MEIYCKNTALLEKAVDYSKSLGIDHHNAVINIKRLPPTMPQKGLVEFSKGDTEIDIYIKYDNERFMSLAHEMVHARQVLTGQPLDENEAYLLENTLDNDPQKRL